MSLPLWIELALGEWDVTEVSGSGNNPTIQQYILEAAGVTLPDSTNWCGCFCGAMLLRAGKPIPMPLGSAAYPTQWRTYGTAVSVPTVGAVAIKSGATHVGFVLAARGSSFALLGGNQDAPNGQPPAVTIIERQASYFEAFRMPPT